MRTRLDCIPCCLRQALDAARIVSDDEALHTHILGQLLKDMAGMDLAESPPAIVQRVHRRLRELSGDADPYRALKTSQNRLATGLLPEWRQRIAEADDPLWTALRLSIAANVIDLGVHGDLTEGQIHSALEYALDGPLIGDYEALHAALAAAPSILFLADNAGEIVLDRLLIEQLLPDHEVVLAVRGGPVINDATREDAEQAGLHDLLEVIENGSDAPGTILEDCSETFRARFFAADLILAKGQGNFETLSDAPADIVFLFKAKCPVVADKIGVPLASQVIHHQHATEGSLLP